MREFLAHKLVETLTQIASIDSEIILLVVLLVISVIVIDAVSYFARATQKKTGFRPSAVTVSIDGKKSLPERNYVSEIQGLAGRPDALIYENGFVIPVERKPLAKKLHERYIAQLLVYMRLVEEFEGKKPPYGYLILGPNCRRFKIDNTSDRQAWLQKMIDEMHEVIAGAPARPEPQDRKCKKCDVREHCNTYVETQASRSQLLAKRA